jgi:hypothetical protein
MFITRHAVRRYVERVAPELTERQARARLIRIQADAEPTGRRTATGETIWRVRDPDALLVSKHDRSCGAVCVTVIGPASLDVDDEALIELSNEIVEAASRAATGMHPRE